MTLDREAKAKFPYPVVIQTDDGKVHITYTWQRSKIRYFIADADKRVLKDRTSGEWPE